MFLSKRSISLIILIFFFFLIFLKSFSWNSQFNEEFIRINFERQSECNLENPGKCSKLNKSLLITFWGERSSQFWLTKNLHLKYPERNFDYLIMIYDNSTWNSHPIYSKAIWIRVENQKRFWFIKRFLSRHLIESYRFIWILDEDVQFDFHPLTYECVVNHYQILLSSPGRLLGSISYLITRISPLYEDKIGRWTDFVETGPLIVFHSSALSCLWNFINEKVSSGYGLDLIWCQILSQICFKNISSKKICAILDSFSMNHLSQGINTVDVGNRELPAYQEYYRKYKTKKQSFGPIDQHSSILYSCTNQSMI
ncbi:unnamed protein product [Adineta ricciae]|uniref:Uncharacterized protein n=1 Tax=Adineta ricciae TaxID=249248 RepID=A0A815TP07_ADIRI|nr:unnamed protein product [Adineta ricciae]